MGAVLVIYYFNLTFLILISCFWRKAHIPRHLNQEARGCAHLVLWLDCDREGENICFEGDLLY